MAFRAKSAERALEEIRRPAPTLRRRRSSRAVDNILDMGYFRTLLPRAGGAEPSRLELLLRGQGEPVTPSRSRCWPRRGRDDDPAGHREPVRPRAHAHAQGDDARCRTSQLLKWCREHGVRPSGTCSTASPARRPQDYARRSPLIEAIWFLDPPSGYGPVRLDRFSPYHEDPAGVRDGQRATAGALSVPLSLRRRGPDAHRLLLRLRPADGRRPLAQAAPVVDRVQRWMADEHRGGCGCCDDGDDRLVIDERGPHGRRGLRLHGWQSVAYDACDRPRTLTRA